LYIYDEWPRAKQCNIKYCTLKLIIKKNTSPTINENEKNMEGYDSTREGRKGA
jgi:hypothetical protein